MDTTHINILDVIPGTFKKVASTNGGEYAGACPFCLQGTDRFRIWDNPTDGSNPSYWCRKCDENGDVINFVMKSQGKTFMEAAAQLGLKPDGADSTTSKRGYRNMQDYASQHGLDAEDLERAGWKETTYDNRPALEFPTKGGKRYRFLDGDEPRYKSVTGFKSVWYGLDDKVIDDAHKNHAPLVICNGEISTLAARFWGVPAICVAGGGERNIPQDLLQELFAKWDGRLAIAMDCDNHGQQAAEKIVQQLGDKGVVLDLGFDKNSGQDLADFVKLYGSNAIREIKRMMPLPPSAPMTHRQAAQLTRERLDIHNVMDGKPIVIPYTIYHKFGGYAKIGYPGKLTGALAMSGHGKTSWLNGGIDVLLKRGDNGVGIMPEFESDEYHWDRLQRYSGVNGMPLITAEMMMEWELYKIEHKQGVPIEQRMGRALTDNEKQAIYTISEQVEAWQGEFELFPLMGTLEDVFLDMGDNIQDKRARGQLVTFAAFDYVQILRAKNIDDDENSHEYVLGLIKHFCMKHKIHGFVTSQVNKTADKAARDYNKVLQTTDMRFVRDDKINCLITLNPLYDDLGQKHQLMDGSGNYAAKVNIAKNNKGRTGIVNQIVDFRHLRWLDATWDSQSVALDDESVDLSNL